MLQVTLKPGFCQSTQYKLSFWDVTFLVSTRHRRVSKHDPLPQSLYNSSGKQYRLSWPASSVYLVGLKFTYETREHSCICSAHTLHRYAHWSYSHASEQVRSSVDANNTDRLLSMYYNECESGQIGTHSQENNTHTYTEWRSLMYADKAQTNTHTRTRSRTTRSGSLSWHADL